MDSRCFCPKLSAICYQNNARKSWFVTMNKFCSDSLGIKSMFTLIVLSKDSIEVEVANDAIYIHIDKDAHNQINENSPTIPLSPSAPPSPSSIAKSLHRKMSLTRYDFT